MEFFSAGVIFNVYGTHGVVFPAGTIVLVVEIYQGSDSTVRMLAVNLLVTLVHDRYGLLFNG